MGRVVVRAHADSHRVDGASACHAVGVSKVFGERDLVVHALRDVTLSIPRRAFTAIMGPSGSGKSTLLHCLAALDTPTAGRVFLGTTELTALSRRKQARIRRDRIGFVFQSFNLVPTLNALENITLPQLLAGRSPDREWLDHVVGRIGLADRLHHRPSELSGGQQQRIALARALAGRPEVIFADEPTGNLDTVASREMLTLLRDAVDQFDQTVVTVTHDPSIADYADQILYFSDGRVVDPTARSDMLRVPRQPRASIGSGAADGTARPHVTPRPDGQHTMRSRRKRHIDGPAPGRPMVGSDDEVEVARQERWLQRIREQFEAESDFGEPESAATDLNGHADAPVVLHHDTESTAHEAGRVDQWERRRDGRDERTGGPRPVHDDSVTHDTEPRRGRTGPYNEAARLHGHDGDERGVPWSSIAIERSPVEPDGWLPPERSWRTSDRGRDERPHDMTVGSTPPWPPDRDTTPPGVPVNGHPFADEQVASAARRADTTPDRDRATADSDEFAIDDHGSERGGDGWSSGEPAPAASRSDDTGWRLSGWRLVEPPPPEPDDDLDPWSAVWDRSAGQDPNDAWRPTSDGGRFAANGHDRVSNGHDRVSNGHDRVSNGHDRVSQPSAAPTDQPTAAPTDQPTAAHGHDAAADAATHPHDVQESAEAELRPVDGTPAPFAAFPRWRDDAEAGPAPVTTPDDDAPAAGTDQRHDPPPDTAPAARSARDPARRAAADDGPSDRPAATVEPVAVVGAPPAAGRRATRAAPPAAPAGLPPALASLRNPRRPDQTDDALAALESLQRQLDRLGGGRAAHPRPRRHRGDTDRSERP